MVQRRAHPGWYLLALESGLAAALGLLAITFVTYLLGGPIQEEHG